MTESQFVVNESGLMNWMLMIMVINIIVFNSNRRTKMSHIFAQVTLNGPANCI